MVEFDTLTAKPFIQVLDESMCVVREDINDWLQRFLFETENALPINPEYLLYRLSSGIWLSRLAYKLHHTVFAPYESESHLKSQPKSFGSFRGRPFTQRKDMKSFRFSSPLLSLAKKPLEEIELESSFDEYLLTESSSLSSISNELDCSHCTVCTFGNPKQVCAQHDKKTVPSSIISSNDEAPTESIKSKSMMKRPNFSVTKHWIFRNNVTAFLDWCRDLGIQETVLFETNGLIERTEEKNVLLTLMELARLASYYGLGDLPELVRMEREIEALEEEEKLVKANNKVDAPEHLNLMTDQQCSFEFSSSTSSLTSFTSSLPNASRDNLYPGNNDTETMNCNTTNTERDPKDDSTKNDSTFSQSINSSGINIHLDSMNMLSPPSDTILVSGKEKLFITDVSFQVKKKYTECGTSASSSGVGGSSDEEESIPSDLASENPIFPKNLKDDHSLLIDRKISVTDNGIKRLVDDQDDSFKTPKNAPTEKLRKLSTISSVDDRKNSTGQITQRRQIRPPNPNYSSRKASVTESINYSKTPVPNLNSIPTPTNRFGRLVKSSSRDSILHNDSKTNRLPSTQPSSPSVVKSEKFKDHDVYDMVHKKIFSCSCKNRIHFQRIDEGRYRLGSRVYYLRKFRSHIMVRVGGGWLTLDEFLSRNDPCRKNQSSRSTTRTNSISESSEEIKNKLKNDKATIEWNKIGEKLVHEPKDSENCRIIKHGILLRSNH